MKKAALYGVLLASGLVAVASVNGCTASSTDNGGPDAGDGADAGGFDASLPDSTGGEVDGDAPDTTPPPVQDSSPPPPVDAGHDASDASDAGPSTDAGDGGVIVGCIPQEVSTRYDATWLFGHGCRADWNAQNQLTLATSNVVFTGFEGTIAAANALTGALFATSDGINLYDGTGT